MLLILTVLRLQIWQTWPYSCSISCSTPSSIRSKRKEETIRPFSPTLHKMPSSKLNKLLSKPPLEEIHSARKPRGREGRKKGGFGSFSSLAKSSPTSCPSDRRALCLCRREQKKLAKIKAEKQTMLSQQNNAARENKSAIRAKDICGSSVPS